MLFRLVLFSTPLAGADALVVAAVNKDGFGATGVAWLVFFNIDKSITKYIT